MEDNKVAKGSKLNAVKDFFMSEHTPLEKGLMISTALCAGIIIGFIASPVKKGIAFGSYNGCGWSIVKKRILNKEKN